MARTAAHSKKADFKKADGETEQNLLEAAGEVFGDKGFDRATGKEICERAGVNTASINYYFGSLEGLYNAVLEEAHKRLFTFDALSVAVAAEADAAAKLHAITTVVVRAATGPLSDSWVLRVVGREIVAPSLAREPRGKDTDSMSKVRLIREVIGEFMGVAEDHPAVASAFMVFVAPLLVLLVIDRPTLRRTFPGVGLASSDADALIENLHRYALGGLSALASKARESGAAIASQRVVAAVENSGTKEPRIEGVTDPNRRQKHRKPGKKRAVVQSEWEGR